MQDPTEKHVSDVGILDKYNYYYYYHTKINNIINYHEFIMFI
jgi:hypothetical protein